MSTPPSDTNRISLTILGVMDELPRLNAAVQSFLDSQAVPPASVFATHLVIEEMVTNVIKYGHDDKLAHEIVVTLIRDPTRLAIRIEDDGHEFNPLALPPPDTSPPLEKRKIGGLGIHLVRHTVNEINYRRVAGRNLLDMAIHI